EEYSARAAFAAASRFPRHGTSRRPGGRQRGRFRHGHLSHLRKRLRSHLPGRSRRRALLPIRLARVRAPGARTPMRALRLPRHRARRRKRARSRLLLHALRGTRIRFLRSAQWKCLPRAIWAAIKDFLEDGCTAMAAGLSFYTLFAIPPLLA